jgi:flavin-dependent dehydrogenase
MFPRKDVINIGVFYALNMLDRHHDIRSRLEYLIREKFTVSKLLLSKKVINRQGGYIPLETAKHLCADSALVVGDAAGLVHPFAGAGIDSTLNSGFMAAQVIDRSLKSGNCSLQMLWHYEKTIRTTGWYRFMRNQSLAFKILSLRGRVSRKMYPRLLNVVLNGNNASRPKKIASLLWPNILTR